MTLSSVVLPEPFGPIRPTTVFSATGKVTSLTATTPPNRLTIASIDSNAPAPDARMASEAPDALMAF
jgi:hypothetical protein